ncbi:MAG: glucokinase [Proteobacteria bacterium]|nr:glucokinase [Pseudomonadota bacterium]
MSLGLVADIGGTNVRFALTDVDAARPSFANEKKYATKAHSDIAAAAKAYLDDLNFKGEIAGLVFGVAGPVQHGAIHLTNAGWTISEDDLRQKLKIPFARVLNDFETLAEAVPEFEAQDLKQIGPLPFLNRRTGTMAIVGPGTGLGVGGLIRSNDAMLPLVTEGGHANFAPTDDLEIDVLRILLKKYGRVSNERLISGPGLQNLYYAMGQIEGRAASDIVPEDITRTAREQPDSFEAKVFGRFCAILGSVAGNYALGMGARGGVLIAGGILPDAVDFFLASDFRQRFEDKGRFADYMKAIPTALIVDDHAGLRGAAAILRLELGKR